MAAGYKELRGLLRQVSRSFYLTLRILPRSIRTQISLAYLLARIADTIADTRLADARRRLEALREVREAIRRASEGRAFTLLECGELAQVQNEIASQGTSVELALLKSMGKALDALREFASEDRRRIRDVLDVITHGQETDLIRFGAASADRIDALKTDAELDDYTYSVAGCVGEFWTKMSRVHVFPLAQMDEETFLANSIRFGKGLQLVNILRDLPQDLRQGRCYIPENQLADRGLRPMDLLDPAEMSRFRPLYDSYLRQADNHLWAGWLYTMAIPFSQMRIRLACAWPILIGIRTLARLARVNVLEERRRIRLSHPELIWLVLQSLILYPFPKAWNQLFRK